MMGVQKWDVTVTWNGGASLLARAFVADWWTDGSEGLSQQIYDWLKAHDVPVLQVTLVKGIDGHGAVVVMRGDVAGRFGSVMCQIRLRAASITASGVG